MSVTKMKAGVLCTIRSLSLILTNCNSKQDDISVKMKDSVKQHNTTMPDKLCLYLYTYNKQGPEYHNSWNKPLRH